MTWWLPLVGIAVLAGGCGGSSSEHDQASSSASSKRPDPVLTAREFIDALAEEDASAFCRIALPSIQRPNFASVGAPPDGSCVEQAQAMFDYRQPTGEKPFWVLAAQAKVGPMNLHCTPGTEHCPTATIELENLPMRGGGTTSAPLPLTYTGGQWRVGSP